MLAFVLRPWNYIRAASAPARNVILALVLVSLSILVIDGWRSWNAHEAEMRNSRVILENLASLIAAQTEATFELTDTLVAANVRNMEVDTINTKDRARIRQALIVSVQNSPRILVVSIFDDKGNWVVNSSAIDPDMTQNFAGRDYFQYHRSHDDQDLHLGQPIQRKTTQEWAITLSRRWNKPDGSFGGVVVGAIALDYFQQFFKTLHVGQQGVLGLLRDDGIILARHPLMSRYIGQNVTRSELFSKYLPQAAEGVYRNRGLLDGVDRLVSYRHLSRYPVVVSAAFAIDDIFAAWRMNALLHFAMSLFLLAILGALGMRLVRQMNQRMADVLELQQGQIKVGKLNQELHARTRQAEAASLAKSQFLANMSHEIRTPMNAVLGMLQLLEHTPLTARQLDYLQKVNTSAGTLLGIINDILDFSKVEAGKMTLDVQAFRLDQLLRDLAVVLSASVNDKPIEVLFNVDPDLPASILGDSLRLRQVLLNLTGNAIKFTQSGEVLVTVRHGFAADGAIVLHFEVRDTGIGIAEDQLAHIFEGFSQAEASTTRRFGGTGLGLAISQRLVQLMGGQLQVSSEAGRGSCFSFSLQLKPGPPLAAEPGKAGLARQMIRRTLVVDDNALARKSLAQMALSLGWRADTADSGAHALTLLQNSVAECDPYNLILLDWMMPDMDGMETAHHIRLRADSKHMPIVVMVTAHARALLAERAKTEEMQLDGYLFKPVTASALLDAVSAVNGAASLAQVALPAQNRLLGMRLLVVEDNPLNQQVALELLSHEGAEVTLAGNGQAGVEAVLCAEKPFDAVLMDIHMPVMDGYSATRLLRQHSAGGELIIIAMTANAMAVDREACLNAGMNDHIAKPFELGQLVKVLRQHVKMAPPQAAQAGPIDSPPAPDMTGTFSAQMLATAAAVQLDLPNALARVAGSSSFLRTALGLFCNDATQMAKTINALLLQNGALAEIKPLLHTLKGSAAIVGADSLADMARMLELQIQAFVTGSNGSGGQLAGRDAIERELSQLAAGLEQTAQAIVSILLAWHDAGSVANGAEDAVAGPPHGASLPRTDLLALCELLAASNMAALDLHEKIHPQLAASAPQLATELGSALERFDFFTGVQLCRRLLQIPHEVSDA